MTTAGLVLTVAIFWATRSRDRRIRRAELLRNYTNDFYGDERMTKIFMEVDQETYSLGPDDYGTDEELGIIRLLDFFNVIGHNCAEGVFGLSSIVDTTLGYAIVRVSNNPYVIEYLQQIERWDEARYSAGTGFGHFRGLARTLANFPVVPKEGSGASRVLARLNRSWYARSPAFFARSHGPVSGRSQLAEAETGKLSTGEAPRR